MIPIYFYTSWWRCFWISSFLYQQQHWLERSYCVHGDRCLAYYFVIATADYYGSDDRKRQERVKTINCTNLFFNNNNTRTNLLIFQHKKHDCFTSYIYNKE